MDGSRCAWLVGGLALLLLISCSRKQDEAAELIRPVRYERVFATGGMRIRTFSGTAQAGLESKLSFKVPGTVERVTAKVGDEVEKGQVLARLDDSDYRLQVEEAEAALAQAQAQHRNAKSIYERTQALYERRNASKQDLDGARAAYESAAAQVQSIGKRLELAGLRAGYTRLTAPFDGAVAAVRVEENENVATGTPVIVLNAGGRPEVDISVPEALIAQVKAGSAVTVNFDAVPGKTFEATVTEVGVAPTGFATTFPVTVRLNRPAGEVRPGIVAEVAFRFETAGTQERVVVPLEAVGEDREGRFVFIVEPAGDGLGLARRRMVTVGELTSEGLEILDGVEEGELVITAGVSFIVDGQKVKLL